MADSSKEELVQLIKRCGAYLTLKISNLFPISSSSLQHQNSHSIWALVGLAIAIIFTWKILRAPGGYQRRQRRQHRHLPRASVSGVSPQSSPVIPSTGVFSYSDESKAQDVIDELFHPGKPTLAQSVRQKLNEGRKVTCRLLGVILEESSPEELQKHVTVKSSVLEVLLEIAKICDLYLMERVLDDESVEKVLSALDDAGVFISGALVKDKVLFCSTENGRSSFVRQLEPDWHIDTNPEIISQLARFIKYELHISPNRLERTASNRKINPTKGPIKLPREASFR
ncbi:peroxisome biogenesis protein 22 isoform X1 [Cinnamomum micranthum f. kanehirae]|uniref:Peroxisome biogenesis protein 22 isoform X1 n=1 Tax=Cinnamomum micranthum f. kanehirae TaxID=337451 RepID=A0A3S3N0E7_9MAGN|nr:peroxisome biogenesis protein 22 isoform X1 [Cinnamomum micranthum f. kanehirae]